jgi:hypothetical protein
MIGKWAEIGPEVGRSKTKPVCPKSKCGLCER